MQEVLAARFTFPPKNLLAGACVISSNTGLEEKSSQALAKGFFC